MCARVSESLQALAERRAVERLRTIVLNNVVLRTVVLSKAAAKEFVLSRDCAKSPLVS